MPITHRTVNSLTNGGLGLPALWSVSNICLLPSYFPPRSCVPPNLPGGAASVPQRGWALQIPA